MSDDHYVHRLQVSMPLATAERIADAALAAGREAGLLPLTVAVLDAGGTLVLLKRQDGSGVLFTREEDGTSGLWELPVVNGQAGRQKLRRPNGCC